MTQEWKLHLAQPRHLSSQTQEDLCLQELTNPALVMACRNVTPRKQTIAF